MVKGGAALYALILLAASLGKLDAWLSWQTMISEITPRRARRLRATLLFGIPGVEGVVAVALFFLKPQIALLSASILLSCFAAGVLLLIPRHGGAECNCFGAFAKSTLSYKLAARNVILAVGALGLATVSGAAPTLKLPEVLLAITVGLAVMLVLEFVKLSPPFEEAGV